MGRGLGGTYVTVLPVSHREWARAKKAAREEVGLDAECPRVRVCGSNTYQKRNRFVDSSLGHHRQSVQKPIRVADLAAENYWQEYRCRVLEFGEILVRRLQADRNESLFWR
jgi:hypothetical protein